MGGILTFGEVRDGRLRRPSLEAVSEARRLADALAARVETVLLGSGVKGLAAELGRYGADRVHVFDDPALAPYATQVYARALAQVSRGAKPGVVLVPFTAMGKDLAPRVAAKIGAGLVSDCVALTLQEGRLLARRPMYAGKAYATVRWEGEPQMATLRANVFALRPPDAARGVEVVAGTPGAAGPGPGAPGRAAAPGENGPRGAPLIA